MSNMTLDTHDVRDSQTANKYLEQGKIAENAHDRIKAIELYEAAFAADPDNLEVCFRLAYLLDLVGEEDEALHLYEQAAQHPSPPLNVLVNLAVMYEDRNQYAAAERCIQQVLATDATHDRAELYLKDIRASREMSPTGKGPAVGDDSQGTLRGTPINDFELSLRTRNALRKMNIRTLGDLLRTTELELRSFKNLGEASLSEIRAMLAQRGFKIGQDAEQQNSGIKDDLYENLRNATGQDDSVLGKPVADLQLSVRARKALNLLGIETIGDLCMRTEAELMGVKNFGMTSLLEIKQKLADMSLSLRQLTE